MPDYVLTELTYKLQTGLYYQSPDTNKIKYDAYKYVRQSGDSFAGIFNGKATIEIHWGAMPSDPSTVSTQPLCTSTGRIYVGGTGDGSHPYRTQVQLSPPLSFTVPEDATNAAFLLFKNGSTVICGVPIVLPSDPSINYEYSHYYDKGPGLILQADKFYPGDLITITDLSINQPTGSLTDAPFFTLTQQAYYGDTTNYLAIGVRMDGDPSGQSVNLSTSDGHAHSGVDYVPANTTLTWVAGDPAVKIVKVQILNDASITPVDFNITLSNANPSSALKQQGYISGFGVPNGASIYQAKAWIKKPTTILLPPPPPPPPNEGFYVSLKRESPYGDPSDIPGAGLTGYASDYLEILVSDGFRYDSPDTAYSFDLIVDGVTTHYDGNIGDTGFIYEMPAHDPYPNSGIVGSVQIVNAVNVEIDPFFAVPRPIIFQYF